MEEVLRGAIRIPLRYILMSRCRFVPEIENSLLTRSHSYFASLHTHVALSRYAPKIKHSLW